MDVVAYDDAGLVDSGGRVGRVCGQHLADQEPDRQGLTNGRMGVRRDLGGLCVECARLLVETKVCSMTLLEKIGKVESFGVGLLLGLILALWGVRGELNKALEQSERASRNALLASIQLEATVPELQRMTAHLKSLSDDYSYYLRVKHGE